MTRIERHTIMLHQGTIERLKGSGTMGDTYDTLINRLLDHYHNFTISPSKPNPRVKKL